MSTLTVDQDELIERIAAGEPFDGSVPERIDTHISVVFLTGDRAYKLKRAIRTDYLDHRRLDDRKGDCDREIEINRRTAPDIYLRTVAVTEDGSGALRLGGDGTPREWLVEMRRFDPRATFDALAARGPIDRRLLTALADRVARLHRSAAVVRDPGFPRTVADVIETNRRQCRAGCPDVFDAAEIEALAESQAAAYASVRPAIERRADTGHVRECHGDLHLGNICLFEGQPTIFDAIEFSDAFRQIDTFYDLAFLLMDLAGRRSAAAAGCVFNRYLFRLPAVVGLRALPLYQSLRAGVRAHVTAMSAREAGPGGPRDRRIARARDYLRMAGEFLTEPSPRLVAIGGYSGTGKTTVANWLAPEVETPPGAVVLGSDLVRKRRFAAEPTERLRVDAYCADATAAVYDELLDLAGQVLAEGRSAIVDATFMSAGRRAAVEQVARSRGMPFHGYWLTGDPAVLAKRIGDRRNDASDATPDVLSRQFAGDPGETGWRRLDATASLNETYETIRRDFVAGVRRSAAQPSR